MSEVNVVAGTPDVCEYRTGLACDVAKPRQNLIFVRQAPNNRLVNKRWILWSQIWISRWCWESIPFQWKKACAVLFNCKNWNWRCSEEDAEKNIWKSKILIAVSVSVHKTHCNVCTVRCHLRNLRWRFSIFLCDVPVRINFLISSTQRGNLTKN